MNCNTHSSDNSCGHHGHSFGHGHGGSSARRLILAFVVIASFAGVEVVGGLISGSLALLADAGHMITDAAALALALTAHWLAKKAPSDRFQFGFKRAQVLAAFVNALGLIAIVVFLVVEAVGRFGAPPEINAGLMLTIAVAGLGANIAAFLILHPRAANDVNVRGAMLHVAADIFGSVAAIVSAVIIMATGFVLVDALLSMLVCALIVRTALPLLLETGAILLQAAPPNVTPQAVKEAVQAGTPAVDVHAVRAWQLTPGETMIALHAVVPARTAIDRVMVEIKQILREEFGAVRTTVQIEVLDEVVSLSPRVPVCPDQISAAE